MNVRVNRRVTIPASELSFRFTPSGGPGGQHANRSATRVELVWNVEESAALGPRQKARVRRALRGRLDAEGNLRLVSGAERSQARNRADVVERLGRLVSGALAVPKRRVRTKPSAAARERRMKAKRRRSEVKRLRRTPPVE
ncbi:MAG TPA: alternative ribosome rescue aminoacyl-tRNA hydrolase ArfB [Actinomycetota bacterium]